jgi:glycine cleavage system transcriptional repressor
MMLICEGTASAEQIRSALASLSEGGSLSVEVRDIAAEQPSEPAGAGYVLTVHGGDRPGIVSAVVSEVAAVGGNVTDLTTRLAGDLYLLIAEIDLPADADPDALATSLAGVATDLGVRVTLAPAETEDL